MKKIIYIIFFLVIVTVNCMNIQKILNTEKIMEELKKHNISYNNVQKRNIYNDNIHKHINVQKRNLHKRTLSDGVYDYIVIGGGAAGSLVASQLAEITDRKFPRVLVLEKGEDDTGNFVTFPVYDVNIPFSYSGFIENLPVDVINSRDQGLVRALITYKGKTLGGGYSISGNAHQIQDSSFYDLDWVQDNGLNPDIWSSYEMTKCSIWLENVTDPYNNYPFHVRGHAGPIKVMKLDQNDQNLHNFNIIDNFLDVFNTTFNSDSCNGNQEGLAVFQRNIGHKIDCTPFDPLPCPKRYTTYSEMLKPIESQSNLDIITLATVTKIEFLPNSVQAKKVHYIKNGKSYEALLKDEGSVIVTAGPITTPKILLQSGVGPCDELAEFDIDCIVNSKEIGKNYKDHQVISILTLMVGMPDTSTSIMTGYLKSPWSDRIDTEIAYAIIPTGLGVPIMLTQVILLRQNTSGYINLRYKDPLSEPDYAHNFDMDGIDGDKMKHFINLIRKWHQSLPIYTIEIDPSCDLSDPPTVSELKDLVGPYWHSSSSAKLGTVLDDFGKIIGTDNVYVMDSSAMPVVGTHPAMTIASMALKMVGKLRPDNAKC